MAFVMGSPALQCRELFSFQERVLGKISRKANPGSFEIIDRDFGFDFKATLSKEGEMRFTVFLADPYNHIRSQMQGHRIFDESIEHFGLENIKSIHGVWNQDSVNFRQFQMALLSGLDAKAAALKTWTALQTQRHGFTKVQSIEVYEMNLTGEMIALVEFVRE